MESVVYGRTGFPPPGQNAGQLESEPKANEVVLTVDPENIPAVSAYKRLGFNLKSEVIEGRLSSRRFYQVRKLFRKAKRNGSDDFMVTI